MIRWIAILGLVIGVAACSGTTISTTPDGPDGGMGGTGVQVN